MEQREALPTGVEVFRITGPLFFGVAGELLDALRRVGQKPRVIVLRMRLVPLLDASGARALEEFVQQARIAGVKIVMSGVQRQPMSILDRLELGRLSDEVHHATDRSEERSVGKECVSTGRYR